MPLRDRAPNLIGDGPSAPTAHVPVHLPNTFVFLSIRFSSTMFRSSDDRRDPDERDDKGDDELKPLTREELKQRALEQVKNLERKALQEQNKYSDPTPATAREKSSTGASRGAPGETSKAATARPR